MFDGPLQDAIDELSRLPGIGPKGAQRIAFHLIDIEDADLQRLLGALAALQGGVQYCTVCHNVSVEDLCTICGDNSRDASTICVVEEAKDIQVVEKSGEYQGRYHVLGGALDPLAGIGPKELTVALLAQRVGAVEPHIKEVILAMDPNTEGEATAAYITRLLKDFPGLVISRLASGIPMGGDLEFVDELTLARSLRERRTLTG